MSSDIEVNQVKDVFIPKGTRVKIQGCPFYLAEDAKIQDPSEDSQRNIDFVLAEEKADMDGRASESTASLKRAGMNV